MDEKGKKVLFYTFAGLVIAAFIVAVIMGVVSCTSTPVETEETTLVSTDTTAVDSVAVDTCTIQDTIAK